MRKFILLFAILFSTLFGVNAQQLVVTGDGEAETTARTPVYGLYMDYQQKCQMIYPAAKLTELTGNQITKITFFGTNISDYLAVNNAWGNDLHIRMACTTQANLADAWFTEPTTEVYVGKLSFTSDLLMVVELDTPFEYTGNNLFIEFDLPVVVTTTYNYAAFQGTKEETAVVRQAESSGYSGAGTPYEVLPKLGIDYVNDGGSFDPVSSVQATVNGTDVNVTWNAPAAKATKEVKTFSFDTDLEGWTNIDKDGDGHIWYHSSEASNHGTMAMASNSGTGHIMGESYCNAGGALNPDNYFVAPQKYTMGNSSSISFWVCAQDANYPSEHFGVAVSTASNTEASDFTTIKEWTLTPSGSKSIDKAATRGENGKASGVWYQVTCDLSAYAGQSIWIAIRHFNVSDQFIICLDDVEITTGGGTNPTGYTYTVTRNGVDVATGLTETSYVDQNVAQGTYDYCVKVVYTEGTSEAVCAEAVTVVEPDCEPAANVKAAFIAGSAVDLAWTAPAKGRDVLLTESFEAGSLPTGWTVFDADGDGYNWDAEYGVGVFPGHNGGNCISSASYINYVGALNPDNYLITPLVEGATSITYWVSGQDAAYAAEKYQVLASSTGTAVADFTSVFEETMTAKDRGVSLVGEGKYRQSNTPQRGAKAQGTWYERTVELPAGTKYIAFRHFGTSDMYWLNIDDVTVNGGGVIPDYTYTITKNGTDLVTGLTTTTYTDTDLEVGTFEYCVKVVYADCTSAPACAAEVVIDEIIVCNPATDVVATATGSTVDVTWTAPVAAKNTVVLAEDFTAGIPDTWLNVDADGDGRKWITQTTELESPLEDGVVGSMSAAYVDDSWLALTPDNWLISPEVTGATEVTYQVYSQGSTAFDNETYGVYVSSTGTNVADFTSIHEENIHTSIGSTPTMRTHAIPAGTKYIAWRHFNSTDQYVMILDNITVNGSGETPITDYTYTVTRDGAEVATGLTTASFKDENLATGTYEYCVKVVYPNCTSVAACAAPVDVVAEDLAPVINLQGTPNGDAVTLTWQKPGTTPNPTGDVTIILEAHDVWGDGSGYQMVLDADANEYGNTIPESGPIYSDCNVPATLYDVFEYTVPEGADPSCTSTNIVMDGSSTITIPAGVYDFCIVNPAPYDRMWVAAGETSRVNDYTFESGKTYHFLMSLSGTGNDMSTLTITDSKGNVVVLSNNAATTVDDGTQRFEAATIGATPNTLPSVRALTGYKVYREGTLIGEINDANTLTYVDNGVAAGTYNYCVTAVYGTAESAEECVSVTVGATCNPATNVSAVINQAVSTTVDVTWTAPASKEREIILAEKFESGALPTGWTVFDADGDGYNWDAETGVGIFEGHNGGNCISSASYINYVGALTPDNYLITPLVEGATSVTYWVSAQDGAWAAEKYQVLASTSGTAVADFTSVFEETMVTKGEQYEGPRGTRAQGTWYERTVTLPAGTKYVAWRHFGTTDMFWLNLDDVEVSGGAPVGDYTYTVTRDGTTVASNLTATSYSDTNVADGSHVYCVTVVYPTCTSEPACANPVVVDIEDAQANAVRVYPNPAKDVIYVKGNAASVMMYNSFGQAVKSGINNGQIDVTSLANGIYYLVITGSDESRQVEKVIIAK